VIDDCVDGGYIIGDCMLGGYVIAGCVVRDCLVIDGGMLVVDGETLEPRFVFIVDCVLGGYVVAGCVVRDWLVIDGGILVIDGGTLAVRFVFVIEGSDIVDDGILFTGDCVLGGNVIAGCVVRD